MALDVHGADILRAVLDRWKAGIDTQQPERVPDVFTEDAKRAEDGWSYPASAARPN